MTTTEKEGELPMAEEPMDDVDKLYEKYNLLANAGEKIAEHEQEYLNILEAVKGSSNEKRLASQFIAKFFKHFATHSEKAIDALLDLCEDEDVAIRKQAIRDLPTICKESKEYVPKITDILAQLLLADDPSELQIVNASLVSLCRLHPQAFLSGLFSQIESGDDMTRERAIRFLAQKMKTLPEELWTKEVEEYLLQETRKVIQDCTKDEFVTLMTLLSGLKLSKLVSCQQVLVEMITEQAELDNQFDANDGEAIDKLLMCIRHASPYFSPFVNSNVYVQYICLRVIPGLDKVTQAMSQEMPGIELEVLQLLAEITPYLQPSNENCPVNIEECQQIVFNKLLEYIPLPPEVEGEEGSKEGVEAPEEPTLQLTHVEALMFAFHQFGKSNPDFLTMESRLRDFKLRLQYLARGVQNYIKKLKESLATVKKGEEMRSEDNKLKFAALKTTTNINTLIRDLFHIPPSFKSTVILSWKPIQSKAALIKATAILSSSTLSVASQETTTEAKTDAPKRKAIMAPEGGDEAVSKKEKVGLRQIYAPPGGKFSGTVRGNFSNSYRGRGGFRGRGGGSRGRGRGFVKRYSY